MTSDPQLQDATASYDGTSTHELVLYDNASGQGYVAIVAFNQATSQFFTECDNAFTTLYRLGVLILPGIQDHVTIQAVRCSSDADTDCGAVPPVCTGDHIVTSHIDDVGARAWDPGAPAAPSGLVITPGNGTLRIQWNPAPGDIFAYRIQINIGGTTFAWGYSTYNRRDITLPGLANGQTYSIEVSAVNHSGIVGPAVTGAGTPGAVPACDFGVS